MQTLAVDSGGSLAAALQHYGISHKDLAVCGSEVIPMYCMFGPVTVHVLEASDAVIGSLAASVSSRVSRRSRGQTDVTLP